MSIHGRLPKYVKILTDSQSALKALDSIDFKSTRALKTAEALEKPKMENKRVYNSMGKSPHRNSRQ